MHYDDSDFGADSFSTTAQPFNTAITIITNGLTQKHSSQFRSKMHIDTKGW